MRQLRRDWRFGVVLAAISALLLGGSPTSAATPGLPIELPELAAAAARFAEPLVPSDVTSAAEDAELSAAIARETDGAALEAFAAGHPSSGWRLAILVNLGLGYHRDGYLPRALEAFSQAWEAGRTASEPHARALADRAAGELLGMQARLGHVTELAALLDSLKDRGLSGPATELRDGARETLWLMRNDPNRAFRCGPAALRALLLAAGVPAEKTRFLDAYEIGRDGTSLAELGSLATQAGLPHRLIRRAPGDAVPVPSLVHWTTNHFGAIVAERDGRYEIVDPGSDVGRIWVTRAALDSEASGLFLVPGEVAGPWRAASADEAARAHGAMPTRTQNASETGPEAGNVGGNGTCHGMCGYSFTEMVVSLSLADTPVGYTPPKGPPVPVTITYNQREAYQPATFGYFNVSPKWTLNWLSYIIDDPTAPGANVSRYRAGGGLTTYTGYVAGTGLFAPESRDRSTLALVAGKSAFYRRTRPDGSVEVFGLSDGATTAPRRFFLTQMIDPVGNAVTLNYDSQLRLTSIVDATGRATTFAYELAGTPLLVTRITDPFGRFAKLAYDSAGRLSQITDVLGLTSAFSYDSSSLVNALTTPYGTTTFSYGGGDTVNQRYVQATDPLGYTERLEWVQGLTTIPASDPVSTLPAGMTNLYNNLLHNRNTPYWDKHAYAVGRGDYTKARIKHWCEQPDGVYTSTFVDSIKNPLEGRIWTNYIGQSSTLQSGTFNKPIAIGRVLDDGTTQLTRLGYNDAGRVTSIVDPVGRATALQYAANLTDVTAVQQTTASGPVTVAQFTYDIPHLPKTYIDAAGQTTRYSYNAAGQVNGVRNALGQLTTYQYDPLGRLTSITNNNGKIAASFTYDAYDRIATFTDSEGWTVGYSYDALDRVKQETYPDNTTRIYTYKYLDLYSVKDRQNRTTIYTHDAVRNLTSITDPLGQVTKFGYYENGALKTLTDPNGHVTTWLIDVQGRVTGKTYADNTGVASVYERTTSRLRAVTDALGQSRLYSYAVDDRLAGIRYANAINPTPAVSFAYDPYFPRLFSMTDGAGTTIYNYYPPGALGALRLAQEAPPFANSAIAYQYDAIGRVTGRSVGGDVETIGYDGIGRVASHASSLGTFQRRYLGQTGQLTQQGNGVVGTRWTYDGNVNDRRLTNIVNSPVASRYSYAITPEYDISSIAESLRQQTWSYTYDAADQLKTATSSLGPVYKYDYDAAGNLGTIQTPSGSTTVTSNSVNQITTAGSATFSYDANGNLLSDYARTYQWDAENRLIGIGYPGQPGAATLFRYDGLGRRIAIVNSSGGTTGETHYGWCGETLCQARTAADAPFKRYLAEGEVNFSLAMALYYGVDHLGSVRDTIAQNGLKAAHFDYDPYGGPTRAVGSRAGWTDFRYAGLFYEQQSGLYLATYRAYDPVVGKWVSRDPTLEAGGLNLYSYVGGKPVVLKDRIGHGPELVLGGGELGGEVGTFVFPGPGTFVGAVIGAGGGAILTWWTGREIGNIVFSKPPADASDPNGAKAPGKPGLDEGFVDPDTGPNWVPNPNPGRGGASHGWEDDKGRVWCPTGQGSRAHGGPHWDVQNPGGGYTNVYPGQNINNIGR